MIIDCHGHYTTAPAAHNDGARPARRVPRRHSGTGVPDDLRRRDPRDIEQNQLRLLRERGADMTIFSPRAGHGPSRGRRAVSMVWTQRCNDLIARVIELFPETFIGVCQLPQSPGVPLADAIAELERCVDELGFVGSTSIRIRAAAAGTRHR